MRWQISGCLVGMALWAGAGTAAPQVPMTETDRSFVRALHEHGYLPGAEAFSHQAGLLTLSLEKLCASATAAEAQALVSARAQWRATTETWERFSAVRGGALLARRSPREIDFMPTRPESIRRAIDSAPDGREAMERVGAPAKGLPALEWLLWTQPVRAGSPACRYAVRAAIEVASEAEALRAAYANRVQHGWDDEETEYALYEFLNLFDAGVQKLWWEDMGRPRYKASTAARKASFSRTASGTTVAAWRAHWQGLRALAVGVPGRGEQPSLHAYLLAKGQGASAARLVPLVARVDDAMAALEERAGDAGGPDAGIDIGNAVAALKALQQHIEGDTASALQFVVSFFDEDGD